VLEAIGFLIPIQPTRTTSSQSLPGGVWLNKAPANDWIQGLINHKKARGLYPDFSFRIFNGPEQQQS
jgi:hypothetical protein